MLLNLTPRSALIAFSLWATLLFAPKAGAQDFVGTRAMGLAESYRALATGNDAIYFNPAGLSQTSRYSPELHYNFNLLREQHSFDASMVDSKTSAVAAGLGYTFQGSEFTNRAKLQHKATLAMAYPLFPRFFHVGVGLKYVNVSDAVLGNYLNALSADVGALATLPFGIKLAAVGYNLVPIRSSDVPLSAGFAASLDLGPLSALIFGGNPVGFLPQMTAGGPQTPLDPTAKVGLLSGLTLSVDWHVRFFSLYGARQRLSTGIEYLLLDMFVLRAGYMWRSGTENQIASVGVGFMTPVFGFDVALQQNLVNLDDRRFALSIKFFFDPR